MAKSKNTNTDVIEVEAEEVPLEVVINKELQKNNVTDQVIAALKEKFGSMKLKSLDDKESYLILKESKREVAKVRILAEKITKKGREAAIAIQRLWLSKEKEVVGKIDEVESHLASEIKKYDDEQDRISREEAQRKENAYMQRQSTLLKMGANYANGCIILCELTYDTNTLRDADEDIWQETILPKYTRLYQIKETTRIAEEKRQQEEAEKVRSEREALEKERKEMEQQRRELQEQKDAAERADRMRIEEQNRLRAEEQRRVDEEVRRVNNARLQKLMAVMPYDSIDKDMIFGMSSEEEFNKFLSEKTVEFENKKAKEEEARLLKIEADKKAAEEAATQRERERAKKEKEELEANRLREEAEEAERLTQASDKTKWLNLLDYLKAAPNFGMKSSTYKYKAETANSLLKKIMEL